MPSASEEIKAKLEDIDAKLEWLCGAVTKLLADSVGLTAEDLRDEDAWLDEPMPEPIAVPVPTRPPPRVNRCTHSKATVKGGRSVCDACGDDLGCVHNRQSVVNGALCCGTCGIKMIQGGVIGDAQRFGAAAERTEWGANSRRESDPMPI